MRGGDDDDGSSGTIFANLPEEVVVGFVLARVDLVTADDFGRCCRWHRRCFRRLWDERGHLPDEVRGFARTMRCRHALERYAFFVDPGAYAEKNPGGSWHGENDEHVYRFHPDPWTPCDGAREADTRWRGSAKRTRERAADGGRPRGCRCSDAIPYVWPPMTDDGGATCRAGMAAWQLKCLGRQKRRWSDRRRYAALALPLGALHLICVALRYPSAALRIPPYDVLSRNVAVALRQASRAPTDNADDPRRQAWVQLFDVPYYPCIAAAFMSCRDAWNADDRVEQRCPHLLACRIDTRIGAEAYLAGPNFARVMADFDFSFGHEERQRNDSFLHAGAHPSTRSRKRRLRRNGGPPRTKTAWPAPPDGLRYRWYVDPMWWTASPALRVREMTSGGVWSRMESEDGPAVLDTEDAIREFDRHEDVECYNGICTVSLPRAWREALPHFLRETRLVMSSLD